MQKKTPKHAGGRPTLYEPEFVASADKYLKLNQDKGNQVKLPTIESFALFLNVNVDTLYEWAKHYPMFSEALKKIKTEQQKRLLNKGLSGEYNATIAKLVLSANHGMREKTDMTTDGKEIKGNTVIFKDFSDDERSTEV